jgi:UDP-2-acetamido-3-amino-2,3-dideoxy-glucuronate N-acetyltransferase
LRVSVRGNLTASDLAPGLAVGRDVEIGTGVQLGANVVLHDGVRLGDGCEILDGAVIGRPPRLGARSSSERYEPAATTLEDGCAICSHAVVAAGAHIGARAWVGDNALIRERAVMQPESSIGMSSALGNGAVLGPRAKVQTRTGIAKGIQVEEDALIGPGVENVSGGREGVDGVRATVFHRGCVIGALVAVLPGIEVGEQATVGAGAVLTADVAPRTLVAGVPARVVRELAEEELRPTPSRAG